MLKYCTAHSQSGIIIKSVITNTLLYRQQELFLCIRNICRISRGQVQLRSVFSVSPFFVGARVKKSLFINSCCLSGIGEENELRGNQFDMSSFHWVSDVVTWYFAAKADFWILLRLLHWASQLNALFIIFPSISQTMQDAHQSLLLSFSCSVSPNAAVLVLTCLSVSSGVLGALSPAGRQQGHTGLHHSSQRCVWHHRWSGHHHHVCLCRYAERREWRVLRWPQVRAAWLDASVCARPGRVYAYKTRLETEIRPRVISSSKTDMLTY